MEIERTTLLIGTVLVEGMLCELRKDAYKSGLEGVAGYPLNVDAEIAAMQDLVGKKLRPIAYKTVLDISDLLNKEYEAGCRERASIT